MDRLINKETEATYGPTNPSTESGASARVKRFGWVIGLKPGQSFWGQVGPHTFNWAMSSAGPVGTFTGAPYPDAIYNPTNGTISHGDITYINTIGFTGGAHD